MFLGILWWDLRVARDEVDAAEARGVSPGIIANLRATLDQCERDNDDASAQDVARYAARLGPGGSNTVETPADVVVSGALDTARAVKSAAEGTELVAVAVLVVVVLVALRG